MREPYQIVTRDFIERVATIMGPSSAAQCALNDADRRAAIGEPNIGFLMLDNVILVGPVPPELQPASSCIKKES